MLLTFQRNFARMFVRGIRCGARESICASPSPERLPAIGTRCHYQIAVGFRRGAGPAPSQ
jgi:hypothetical protein